MDFPTPGLANGPAVQPRTASPCAAARRAASRRNEAPQAPGPRTAVRRLRPRVGRPLLSASFELRRTCSMSSAYGPRWPSNAIARLCGSNNRRYDAVPNAQIVILACPTHGRSGVPTSSNRGSRLPCSCDVARALQVTMSLGAADAVRARSADRAGRLPSMLWLERRPWWASPRTELTRCSRHEPLRRAFARANKLLATTTCVRSCRGVVADTMTVQL